MVTVLWTPGPRCQAGMVHVVEFPPPPVPLNRPRFHTDSVGAGPSALIVVPPTPVTQGWLGGVVDLEAGVVGAREQVAVLGPFVTGRGDDGLALGHGLLEDRRLGLEVGRRQLRLALAPARGDHRGRRAAVDHGEVGVEGTAPAVGPDVDLDVHVRRHADDHLDVEGRLARPGTGVGVRAVHATPASPTR